MENIFSNLGHQAEGLGQNVGDVTNKFLANPLTQFSEWSGTTALVENTKKGWGKLSMSFAKAGDKAIVANVQGVLGVVGGKLNMQLHEEGMPNAVHSGIDTLFTKMWPEISKDILDGVLLDKGFSFRVCAPLPTPIGQFPCGANTITSNHHAPTQSRPTTSGADGALA